MQITKNGAKKTSKKPKPVRVVKDPPMPSTLGDDRIREAVLAVSRARLANAAKKRGKPLLNAMNYCRTSSTARRTA